MGQIVLITIVSKRYKILCGENLITPREKKKMSDFREQMIDAIIQLNLDTRKIEDFDISTMTNFHLEPSRDNEFRVYGGYCGGYKIAALATIRSEVPARTIARYLEQYNLAAGNKRYVGGFSVGKIMRVDNDDVLYAILREEGSIKQTNQSLDAITGELVKILANRNK